MWLRAARKQFFIRGVTAFLAVIVCGGAFDWGHAGGDDPDCNVVVVAHNHSAHHFAAATSTSPAADHCYICHALRLLHTGLTARRERPHVDVRRAQLFHADSLAARDAVTCDLSSRAPPAARL